MSRRFGRNQKRKLRLQIEAVERDRDWWVGELRRSRDELHKVQLLSAEARHALDYLSEALPRYCALLPAQVIGSMPAIDRISLPTMSFTRNPTEIADATVAFLSLPVVQARLRDNPHEMGAHVTVRFDDGRWGYAMDDRSLRITGPKRAAQHIAQSIASSIVADLESKVSHG